MTHERLWQPLTCPTVRFNQFPESHRLRIVRNPDRITSATCSLLIVGSRPERGASLSKPRTPSCS